MRLRSPTDAFSSQFPSGLSPLVGVNATSIASSESTHRPEGEAVWMVGMPGDMGMATNALVPGAAAQGRSQGDSPNGVPGIVQPCATDLNFSGAVCR